MAPDTATPGRRRWSGVCVGLAVVVVGAVLTLKLFSSLDALVVFAAVALIAAGLGELLNHDGGPAWSTRGLGIALIVTGLVIAVAPGLGVSALALVVGVGLIVAGAVRLAGLRGGAGAGRWADIVGGLACLVLGVLAVAWPDATVLLVALLVGPVAVVLGVRQVIRAWRGGGEPARAGHEHPWLRLAAASAGLGIALLLAGISGALHRGSPSVTAFYRVTGALPQRPGELLRSEPARNGVPPDATGRRILYTTTDASGRIVPASGLVLLPRGPAGPRPVVLWDHGTTGVAPQCAPSLLPAPFKAGGMPSVTQATGRGWAIVAPDYPGLGAGGRHPYLVGVPAARSGLDAVRAARRLPGGRLGPQTVVWGHSQGGGAALWTGVEARRYAPDVPLAGIAALAPASDVLALARSLQRSPSGMLFATFVVQGYANAYPDVRRTDYVRAAALPATRGIASRCLAEPSVIVSLPSVLTGQSVFRRDLTTGALGRRLAQNVPRRPSGTPTFIAQGLSDELVLPAVQERFVRGLCSAGQPVDFRTFAGRDHLSVVAADSPLIPQLLRWTGDRLAGRAAESTCRTG